MTATPSLQSYEFNITPIMKMYLDSMEAWKKNYEAISGTGKINNQTYSEPAKPAYDSAVANWQKSGEEAFKRFIDQQVELCRFFASRWEQYLKLPAQFAHCQTPAEAAQIQVSFLSQFAADYMQETGKLAQPMGELMSQWAGMRHG